ncbi:hypothetical protein WOLCODRAFT_155172 [Wolfiporia cocos MD-104 SS10]|uniref:Uncharacterized protein n=1 Tax=Wolfiporia cocos (strain MD-104) TaxID=742152 RepID=A0A2H3IWZ9_WOLCO|nr:hypothetical protein WOLCODRAFT_155172 [Wolfiporia cocos MD-104 SS10]
MPTDWEVYLDMAIDMYKQLYPDKLKGKIFEEEKKKESSGSGKTSEKTAPSKPAKAADKGKAKADPPKSTDCQNHPGQHLWKDCPDNKFRKSAKPASGSGMTKLTGSSSGSQQLGQKKLDPKKKYKVRVISTQELVTDDKDESPKATVGALSANVPHILEEVVPLTPTTCITKEKKSSAEETVTSGSVWTTSTGSTSSTPNPSGDFTRVRLPWLRQRIADSATALGIHGGSTSGFPTEHM